MVASTGRQRNFSSANTKKTGRSVTKSDFIKDPLSCHSVSCVYVIQVFFPCESEMPDAWSRQRERIVSDHEDLILNHIC